MVSESNFDHMMIVWMEFAFKIEIKESSMVEALDIFQCRSNSWVLHRIVFNCLKFMGQLVLVVVSLNFS